MLNLLLIIIIRDKIDPGLKVKLQDTKNISFGGCMAALHPFVRNNSDYQQ